MIIKSNLEVIFILWPSVDSASEIMFDKSHFAL